MFLGGWGGHNKFEQKNRGGGVKANFYNFFFSVTPSDLIFRGGGAGLGLGGSLKANLIGFFPGGQIGGGVKQI